MIKLLILCTTLTFIIIKSSQIYFFIILLKLHTFIAVVIPSYFCFLSVNTYSKISNIRHLNNWNTSLPGISSWSARCREGTGDSLHMADATATHHPALPLLHVWPLPHTPHVLHQPDAGGKGGSSHTAVALWPLRVHCSALSAILHWMPAAGCRRSTCSHCHSPLPPQTHTAPQYLKILPSYFR